MVPGCVEWPVEVNRKLHNRRSVASYTASGIALVLRHRTSSSQLAPCRRQPSPEEKRGQGLVCAASLVEGPHRTLELRLIRAGRFQYSPAQRVWMVSGALTDSMSLKSSNDSARQPLDMGPALPQLILDALETAVEMIDPADDRLPLGGKPGDNQ